MVQAVAAVALVECGVEDNARFLVLQRSERADDPWSGQLALPGGRRDPVDESLLATAIRETYEECGLVLHPSELLKPLPLSYAGRHRGQPTPVQPFHFQISEAPSLLLDAQEVAAAFWVEKQQWMAPQNHVLAEPLAGLGLFPGFYVGSQFLWGFTYQVLVQVWSPEATSGGA